MGDTDIFEGCLENLPDQQSSVVRVFLSSTFKDMSAERNEILTVAAPELHDFCRGRGLEFEICDMRWGVRDDAAISHSTTDICLRELRTCQKISRGPNFVAILGNRYGYCPYPSQLSLDEFTALRSVIDKGSKDAEMIDRWFRKDANATPPVYILQPINSILQHYDDMDPDHRELFEKDQERWQQADSELLRILRDASDAAFSKGLLTAEAKHRFHRSITEHEVAEGILTVEGTENRVLCFTRDIRDINLTDELAGKFIDLTAEGEIMKESAELLTRLKSEKLSACLSAEQLEGYEVDWSAEGVTPINLQHRGYLDNLRESFIAKVKKMVEASESQANTAAQILREEVLHHLVFCQKKCENFVGRGELIQALQMAFGRVFNGALERMDDENAKDIVEEDDEKSEKGSEEKSELNRQMLVRDRYSAMQEPHQQLGIGFSMEPYNEQSDPSHNEKLEALVVRRGPEYSHPLVVYGESGCGKTAFIAKLAEVLSVWSPRSAWIVRFLGTSPRSSSVCDTIVSLCHQIYHIYDIQPPRFDIRDDFPYLIQYFSALLWRVDSVTRPLYILLDSLDQLNSSDHAFSLNWLPTKLPPNVHVVVSTLPEMYGLLPNLRSRIPHDDLFFEVEALPSDDASNLLFKVWSRTAKRDFTQQQRQLLKSKMSGGTVPLYLKLLFNQAVKWKSFTEVSEVQLPVNSQSAINQLFTDLEVLHGQTLISKAFGYLTAAHSGLSNQEMEHLLSLDDEVLQDVYLYHLPPNPNSVTLPSLIWRRVVYDLGEYLTDKRVDGRTVKTWYHRQFQAVAEERYLRGEAKLRIHSAMVDYFMGIWSNRPKPLSLFKMKHGEYPNAMRQVPDQPLLLAPSVYNFRKMRELPFHLIHAGRWAEFRALVGCNVEWLFTKCKAMGLSETLEDFELALKVAGPGVGNVRRKKQEESGRSAGEDVDSHAIILSDLKLVADLLTLGSDNIRKNPVNVPIQILGQLGLQCERSLYLDRMVAQASDWCAASPHPLLLPQHPCLPAPGGVLKLSINTYVQPPGAFRKRAARTCMALLGDTLLVTEMGGKGDNSDCLRSFDLVDGQCVSTCPLDNQMVNITILGGDRYVQLEWTYKRDGYNISCYQRLLVASSFTPVDLPKHISCLAFSQSFAILAYAVGCDVYVRSGDLLVKSETSKVSKLNHASNVMHIIISPDEKYLVSTTVDNEQLVWSVESMSRLRQLRGEKRQFSAGKSFGSNVFITQNNWLVCPGLDYSETCKVLVTDISSGERVYEFCGPSEYYGNHFVRLHCEGDLVLLGAHDSTICNGVLDKWATLWSLSTGQQVSECSAVNGPYSDIHVFGSDHVFVAACTQESPAINLLWAGRRQEPVRSAVLVRVLVAHNDSIIQLIVSPTQLISVSGDNTVKVWDMAEIHRGLVAVLDTNPDHDSVRFRPSLEEGRLPVPGRDTIKTTAVKVCRSRVVVGSEDGFLIFYDLDTSEQLGYTRLCSRRVVSIVVSSDGEHIVAATPKALYVLGATGDTVVRELPARNTIYCVCEANNVVVAGHGGMEAYGYAWNLLTGEELGKFRGLYSFHCIAINSKATRLGGSFFEYPVVYSVATTEMMTDLQGADVMMTGQTFLTFSPNDRYLAGGCTDGSVRVMDGETAKYLFRFQQLSSAIAGCFSADSRTLVTSGFRTLFLWSMDKGTLLRSLSHHQDFVVRVQFCVGGRYLVSSSKDKTIVVWDWRGLYSAAAYMAHCPVDVMDAAPDLTSVVYAPDSVDYVAILRPNPALLAKLTGGLRSGVSDKLQDAQAMALSFSSQGLRRETTRACVLL